MILHIAPTSGRRNPATARFLEAAGLKPAADHEIHGTSLLPLLTGDQFSRAGALHWENQRNSAVLLGEWKLVHKFAPEHRALYRVEHDVGEDNDLSSEFPHMVAELSSRHAQWKARYYPNPNPRQTAPSTSALAR